MKSRHAAAFALVPFLAACGTGLSVKAPQSSGWQIMQPPQIEGRPDPTPDEIAPLSNWVVAPADIDIYLTRDECERILEGWREASRREGFPQYSKLQGMSRCVSINDPALKGS